MLGTHVYGVYWSNMDKMQVLSSLVLSNIDRFKSDVMLILGILAGQHQILSPLATEFSLDYNSRFPVGAPLCSERE